MAKFGNYEYFTLVMFVISAAVTGLAIIERNRILALVGGVCLVLTMVKYFMVDKKKEEEAPCHEPTSEDKKGEQE